MDTIETLFRQKLDENIFIHHFYAHSFTVLSFIISAHFEEKKSDILIPARPSVFPCARASIHVYWVSIHLYLSEALVVGKLT